MARVARPVAAPLIPQYPDGTSSPEKEAAACVAPACEAPSSLIESGNPIDHCSRVSGSGSSVSHDAPGVASQSDGPAAESLAADLQHASHQLASRTKPMKQHEPPWRCGGQQGKCSGTTTITSCQRIATCGRHSLPVLMGRRLEAMSQSGVASGMPDASRRHMNHEAAAFLHAVCMSVPLAPSAAETC